MQGDFPNNYLGVHAGGHFWVGGDPGKSLKSPLLPSLPISPPKKSPQLTSYAGGDLFASPGDPYFFLHHAQIDRTWEIWQNQDLATRQNALAGTNTLFNFPPSANTTLDDLLDLGVLAPKMKIREAMSTRGEKWCYTYE
jgi:tyrosinase